MRAIIIATGNAPATALLNEHFPTPMFPLLDRPFLQHVIEYCIHQSVTRFDFVLHHHPEKIEAYFGDGKRWGCSFTYHLARDELRPYRLLRVLHFDDQKEPVLLGHAHTLPPFQLWPTYGPDSLPILFCWRDESSTDDERRWSGWALLAPEKLLALPANPDERELEIHFRSSEFERSWQVISRPLRIATFDDMLETHRAVLRKTFGGLLVGAREADPGVWLGRNIKLHPTVQILPPVYIGENCSVEVGVRLGPDVSVSKDCLVDAHCTAVNCAILPGTYVGQHLELADAIVNKNLLVNARLGGAVAVRDALLIGSFAGSHFGVGFANLLGRLLALLLFVLALPVLLVTGVCLKLCRRSPVFHIREVVRLPAPPEARRWRRFRLLSFCNIAPFEKAQELACDRGSFLLRLLPGLVNVVKGNLVLVGLPPRTPEEIRALPPDWQALYLRGKAGLVTEAAVNSTPTASDEELYAAEAFYMARAGWRYDLSLFLRYVARSVLGLKRRSLDELD